jgi:DegV family protein with EDD domain
MKIGLVTDSTSDIPKNLIERYAIEVIAPTLILDGQAYTDGKGISREEFYTRLPDLKSAPTTAAPSAGEFEACYQKLFDQGCGHVISIHAAETLTTIINSARLGGEMFSGKITFADSGSLSMGLGLQVICAAESITRNDSLDQVIAALASAKQRIKVFAMLDSLEYVKRSGRVSWASATIGGLLRLKPLVELRDGKVISAGAARTSQQRVQRLAGMIREYGAWEKIAILHTNALDEARQLAAQINAPSDTPIVNVTTVIGTHVGPNGLGFALIVK